jgi:hypothetical protein
MRIRSARSEKVDLSQLFDPSLGQLQLYALVFLLGSFSVAALSDVRRMSAQREFVEVWAIVVLALLGYDLYRIYQGADWTLPAVKWAIILAISVAAHQSTGLIFSLALGDVAACAAVACLLQPVLAILFYVILKLLDLAMGPFLRMRGIGGAYPFMPVVLVGTMAMAAIIVWAAPWLAARA